MPDRGKSNYSTSKMATKMESDIVITGISGRLPESSNIEEFKENLMKGLDMVTEDERRWTPGILGIPSRFAKLKDLSNFDASFFKIRPKQAHSMDPQLRIMLEASYEALIDAGVNPSTLKGSRTGVFIGVSTSDASNFWKKDPNGYGYLGSSRGMLANRISYVFDLIGPSYSLDTACSSALTVMHQAVLAMNMGECDAAIIGGLNLVLDPAISLHFQQLNILSKDGKCKSFDIMANGYARAEAVVVIFLQKLKDARRVYATVINTAINTDGYKPEGFTYPSSDIQYLMLKEVYSKVSINLEDVVYIEAHGSGTQAGDQQEISAIDRLFCKNRKTPLQIGSVKSNMGHSEAASGICALAKVLIAMETGVIPANLHFSIPNPKIPALIDGRVRVIDKATPWNGGLVGINSFGAGGANSHVILRSNPKTKVSSVPETIESLLPKLIAVSGRTKEAIQVLLDKANEHQQDDEFLALLHTAHQDNIAGHNVRGYEILAHGGTREMVKMNNGNKRSIWFLFSGMGSQWSGMGRELLNIKTCQHSLQQCANILKNHDIDLMNIILNSTDETYENVMLVMISIVAIQIALVDLLTLIGIRPDGIIGHSLGELCCSYADGGFTLEQTILAAYYKGKSTLDANLEPGAMAVATLTWEKAKEMCPPDITPACHNSANLVTISGPVASVKKFVEELKSKEIFAKIIDSSGVAFHSKYILPSESIYRASLDMIIPNPKKRSHRWISSSVPKAAWESPLAQFSSSKYFINNLVSPVLFQEAMAHIPEDAIIIEIGPHCLLQSILHSSLPLTITNICLQNQNYSNNLIFLLSNIGKLYTAGAQPDISKLYPPISFPVSRGTPMIGPLIKWDHSTKWEVPTFTQKSKQLSGEHIVEVNLSRETDAYLMEHKIDGRYVFPGAGFLVMVWKLFAKLHDTNFEQLPVIFKNVWLQRITFIPTKKTIKFSVNILKRKGDFEVREADSIVVSGNIGLAEATEKDQLDLPLLPMPPDGFVLNTEDVYKEFRLRGYKYSGIFKGIKSCDNSITVGELHWFNEWSSYMDSMFQFKLLSIDRRLVYGSKFRYAVIDPVLHKRLTDELPKDAGLSIYHYKNIEVVKSGGIEIRGMKFTTSQRQQIQIKPKYERYVYVPYENPHSLVLEDSARGKLHALTVLLQIACENITTSRIKAMEVANDRDAKSLLAPLILDIFDGEPLVNIDLQVAVNSAIDDYATIFNEINVNLVKWDANDAFLGPNMHLVVAAEVLSSQSYTVLKNLASALNSSCFILLKETATQLDLNTALKKANLILVSKQIDTSGKSYILLKKRKEKRESIVIQITEKNFSWLENAKAVLKKYDSNNQEILFVSQGEELFGLVGFMTCIRREIANVRYIFIQDSNAPKFDLSSQFYAQQLEKELMANVLKAGQWGSYRHLQLHQPNNVQVEHAYVSARTHGDLSSLEWIQSPLTSGQTKHLDKLCSVYYASLNFRNINLAISKQPTDALSSVEINIEDSALGLEFSGRDANGCRVMGIVKSRRLMTTVLPDSGFLWKLPDRWTLEQAATIPVAYVTSYYALFVRGQLKADESVLIHSGAGSIGQAAITIALHTGCTVFTTVDTPEQQLFLKKAFPQLIEKNIGNSRDTSFEYLISDQTQGRGVDVVLNSLIGEKLHASMRCLAKNGRFLEIGKHDMLNGNCVDMSVFLKNISFHGIFLETLFDESEDKRKTIKLMTEGIAKSVVRPLPTTVFSKQKLEEGFKFMMTGQHIGKVLLNIRHEEPQKHMMPMSKMMTTVSRSYMHPEKSYVLIGGLGGFGLELANWMVARGAKIIILVSQTGIRTGYQMLRIQRWRESGIKVVISTADVTTPSGALNLIEESNRLAPVGGIFNLAVVLHDALFENLQVADFEAVNLPKVEVTKNLDMASRKFCPSLDFFVVFSSISCGRGNLGQSNYGLANSAMERMMEQRNAAGLPGLAIQWGIIGDVGLYIDTITNKNINEGILPQRMSSCLATMDIFLRESYPVLASTVIGVKHKSVNDGKVNFVEVIASILGFENVYSMSFNDTFDKLGIDSLGYTEIKQILEREYNIILSFREIQALTISKLRDLLTATDVSGNSPTS
ncbi:fatty acid synthase-like isoform X1 [Nylanderia fulva]|uniref:fatty acid synthase-like isoform X1 n=2 Tax=Nylanderia fulva TaxID=613905 RepID=UPI0010FAD43A|nr:fatty acid synthase-like isoform X1 [Nylanderia fulva]